MITKNPFISYSVAMVTPFNQQENLNIDGIYSLIDYYKRNKVHSLLVSGSTGEQHSMTVEERKILFAEVKKATKDDLLVIGGVAAVRTIDAINLAKAAQSSNLNGIMLGFPPYLRLNQKEAYSYVEQICAVTDLPIMLYNNPPRTGFNLELDTLFKLVEDFPQILALKEAGNPENATLVKKQLGSSFMILTGFDIQLLDNLQNGYDGITSIIGNIYPLEMGNIVQYLKTSQLELAEIHFAKLLPNIQTITELGMIRAIKYVLEEKQIQAGICRSPLSTLSPEEKALLKTVVN